MLQGPIGSQGDRKRFALLDGPGLASSAMDGVFLDLTAERLGPREDLVLVALEPLMAASSLPFGSRRSRFLTTLSCSLGLKRPFKDLGPFSPMEAV